MARPHMVVFREIKARIKGKSGGARIAELNKALDELPGYKTGPYAEIRKWIYEQIEKTKTISKVKYKDWIGITKDGEAQIALVGPPSVGKSSLIKELTGMQVKIADYEFTTLRPRSSIMKYKDIKIQLVDMPGLIEGAYEDKGGGRRLLGIVRDMSGIIYMHDATKPIEQLKAIMNEIRKAKIDKPSIVLCNKMDLNPDVQMDMEFIPISIKTGENMDKVREAIWELTGLIRVFTPDRSSVALKKGATVEKFTEKVHKDFLDSFAFAKIWGKSVKFQGQQVGLSHVLEDDDMVELHTKR